jgi:hypothetical protein
VIGVDLVLQVFGLTLCSVPVPEVSYISILLVTASWILASVTLCIIFYGRSKMEEASNISLLRRSS